MLLQILLFQTAKFRNKISISSKYKNTKKAGKFLLLPYILTEH